jgi:SAM-dependent methyltransferase
MQKLTMLAEEGVIPFSLVKDRLGPDNLNRFGYRKSWLCGTNTMQSYERVSLNKSLHSLSPLAAPRRSLHPFPARMAPEIALQALASLPRDSTVLDPMCGSGTVLREALRHGHRAIGFDLDPLAVLMSRAPARPINTAQLVEVGNKVVVHAVLLQDRGVNPPGPFHSYEGKVIPSRAKASDGRAAWTSQDRSHIGMSNTPHQTDDQVP